MAQAEPHDAALEPSPRQEPPRKFAARALVASAKILDPKDRLTAARQRKTAQEWQTFAWDYFETLPPIHFAHDYYANVVSRVRIYPGFQADPDEPPVPLDDLDTGSDAELPEGLSAEVAQAAIEEMRRLDENSEGGIPGIAGDFALNIALAGEGTLVGREEDGVEIWQVYSCEEFKATTEGYFLHIDGETQGERLAPDDFALRIWRRHRRWRNKADAPMRALLDDCDNLLLLKRVLRAVSGSRIHGGILKVPSELDFPQRATEPNSEGQATDSPLMAALERALITPIQDPSAPNSVVPMEISGPAEILKELQWLDLGRTYGKEVLEQIHQLISMIAIGLDLPNEIVVGMTEANHWTAWEISSQTFKSHVEPLVQIIVRGLTEGYLRTALRARGLDPEGVVVWYDPTALLGHDNLFANMTTMHDKLVVSDSALRRAGGANDDDEPDDDEIKRRLFLIQQMRVQIREMGVAPPAELEPPSDLSNPAPPGEPPAPDQKGAPPEAPPARPGIAASITAPVDPIGRRLMEIDRDLRLRVQTLADQALHRALERAGGRIRANAQRKSRDLWSATRDVPVAQLGRHLGRAVIESWGLAEDDLIDEECDELERQYTRHTKRALAAALALGRHRDPDALPLRDIEDRVEAAGPSISAGFVVLSAAVAAAAHSRLFESGPTPPPVGELDTEAVIPTGTVRQSLAIAGGQQAADAETKPAGVAIGPLVLAAFHEALDIFPTGWQWVYGYPDRPFEPHWNLEGVEFSTWEDELLVNDESFPDVDYYRPGDHLGCQCSYIPMFSSDRPDDVVDEEAPEEGASE